MILSQCAGLLLLLLLVVIMLGNGLFCWPSVINISAAAAAAVEQEENLLVNES